MAFISTLLLASPDGVVYNESETPVGIVEIKCPFSLRDKASLDSACKFCCEDENGSMVLKRSHDYFFQVQGQMAALGVQWCDFIVWAPAFLHTERITWDESFWKNKCLSQLTNYYTSFLAPELIYPSNQN